MPFTALTTGFSIRSLGKRCCRPASLLCLYHPADNCAFNPCCSFLFALLYRRDFNDAMAELFAPEITASQPTFSSFASQSSATACVVCDDENSSEVKAMEAFISCSQDWEQLRSLSSAAVGITVRMPELAVLSATLARACDHLHRRSSSETTDLARGALLLLHVGQVQGLRFRIFEWETRSPASWSWGTTWNMMA